MDTSATLPDAFVEACYTVCKAFIKSREAGERLSVRCSTPSCDRLIHMSGFVNGSARECFTCDATFCGDIDTPDKQCKQPDMPLIIDGVAYFVCRACTKEHKKGAVARTKARLAAAGLSLVTQHTWNEYYDDEVEATSMKAITKVISSIDGGQAAVAAAHAAAWEQHEKETASARKLAKEAHRARLEGKRSRALARAGKRATAAIAAKEAKAKVKAEEAEAKAKEKATGGESDNEGDNDDDDDDDDVSASFAESEVDSEWSSEMSSFSDDEGDDEEKDKDENKDKDEDEDEDEDGDEDEKEGGRAGKKRKRASDEEEEAAGAEEDAPDGQDGDGEHEGESKNMPKPPSKRAKKNSQ
jgi:hypothetical protein